VSDRLDEIRARWAAATPGPWEARVHEGLWAICHPHGWIMDGCDSIPRGDGPDAVAIAAAPEDVAWLVGEVERLRGLSVPPCFEHGGQGEGAAT